MRRGDQRLAQPVEADQREFRQQRCLVGKMLVGRRMADASAAGELPERKSPASAFLEHVHRGVDDDPAKIAVMIGPVGRVVGRVLHAPEWCR